MSLLIFILTCFGLTHILVKGRIFEIPRDWLIVKSQIAEGILTCHQCCGFWAGIAVYFCMFGFQRNLDFFFYGCISSGTTVILYGLVSFLFSRAD
jgi:hypothetical protein